MPEISRFFRIIIAMFRDEHNLPHFHARNGISRYFLLYNMERLHESLGYKTSYEIYVKERLNIKPVQASTAHLN
jgi:hypothetical protein